MHVYSSDWNSIQHVSVLSSVGFFPCRHVRQVACNCKDNSYDMMQRKNWIETGLSDRPDVFSCFRLLKSYFK
jgi:hypothetical protein